MKRKLMLVALLTWVCVAMVVAISTLPSRVANAEAADFSPQEQQEIKKGFAITPVPLNLQGKNRNLVGLGSYIVNAQGGCNDCHTNPSYTPGHDPHLGQSPRINKEHYLAGGQQFGPFVSRNITPDANGLPAGLTLNQFFQVMRRGTDFDYEPPHVPSDSKDLLQVMPWPVYRNMTDRDLRSIYEYLRAIPHAEPEMMSNGTAKHVYELNGSLNDALGGPSLVPHGGTLNATSYSFGPNEGLSLSNAIVPGNYSIEMIFNFESVDGWRRIIEFKNRGEDGGVDEGWYVYYSSLQFYPVASGIDVPFISNVDAHVVVTRDDATDLVVGYVNGVEQTSFTDSTDSAVFSGPGNIIHFFIDDLVFPEEASAGVVDRIRIYDHALTAEEVAALAAGSGFRPARGIPPLKGLPAHR
jgi:Concanavalin A-like lectin/glucanases superfamily